MNREDLQLLEAHLAGTLDPDRHARLNELLRTNSEARRTLRDLATLDEGLSALASRPALEPVEAPPTQSRAAVLGWLALAASLVLAGWLGLRSESPRELATLTGLTGGVVWRDDHGRWLDSLQPGDRLSAGTLSVEGDAASATLVFDDGSRFGLLPNTELSFGEHDGKRLYLRRGEITADVAKQKPGQPLQIRTPTAEAVVVGTSFRLGSEADRTQLDVAEGEVRLRSLADGRWLAVGAEGQASARLAPGSLESSKAPAPLPTTWREDFSRPESEGWIGRWSSPGTLSAVPRIEDVREDGTRLIHYRAVTGMHGEGLAGLAADSRLRVKLRTREGGRVGLWIATADESRAYTGHLVHDLDATPGEWLEVDVPVAGFRGATGHDGPLRSGENALRVFVTSYAEDLGLELDQLELSRP